VPCDKPRPHQSTMKHLRMVLKCRPYFVTATVSLWLSLLLLLAAVARADETVTTSAGVASPTSLFIYLAGGSALTNPDSKFMDTADQFEAEGGRANTVGVLEGGVFHKRSENMWFGLLPKLIAEEFSGDVTQTTSLALTHWNLNASAWWFLHRGESCGLNARLDAGYAYVHEYYMVNGVSSDAYHNGVDAKISIGYALPVFANGDFWSFNLGFFGVTAGPFSETGADITVGIML
jgi:hypothetical protein